MSVNVFITSIIQVLGDVVCFAFAVRCAFFKKSNFKYFYILNGIAFLLAMFCDAYYDYQFRIMHVEINKSVGLAITFPVFIFQLCQAINWFLFAKKEKAFISKYNFPYYIFSGVVSAVLIYYFFSERNLSALTIYYQSISVFLDMLIWIFSIICLSRAATQSIVFLAFGCLMIISADLTTRCLFIFEMKELASASWIHGFWAAGVIVMAAGFFLSLKNNNVKFYSQNSLQVIFSAWISSISLIVFFIGFLFLTFLKLPGVSYDMHLTLWNFPVALMFIMIFSVFSGNRFSQMTLQPLGVLLDRIRLFNLKKDVEKKDVVIDSVYEFNGLAEFIENSFSTISNQLVREVQFAKQVAHDIRSPLTSLEMVVKRLPRLSDSLWVILRDSINHIRDITNNLDKGHTTSTAADSFEKIQLAVLLESVISERRIAFSNPSIKITHDFSADAYAFFVNVVSLEMKRILTNIINNACEASCFDDAFVTIGLEKRDNQIVVQISDNGSGISPELLSSVFTRGFTTKKNGSGLGLTHARENIESWGGAISLKSNDGGRGISVCITLPLQPSPTWFVEKLVLFKNCDVVCIDDSSEIYYAWKERINSVDDTINVLYCNSIEKLTVFLSEKKERRCLYFIDYEFSGEKYNGIDLAKMILQKNESGSEIFFVTSRSNEIFIQTFCVENNIYMIPKFYAFKIPLCFVD